MSSIVFIFVEFEIPARPCLRHTDDDFAEIIDETTDFLK